MLSLKRMLTATVILVIVSGALSFRITGTVNGGNLYCDIGATEPGPCDNLIKYTPATLPFGVLARCNGGDGSLICDHLVYVVEDAK